MMTNLLNGAHVANKLFSTIARLRLLLVMFLTLTASTAWGDTYNFSNIPTTGWKKEGGSQTINGKSWTYSSATYIGVNNSRIQVGSKDNPQTTNWTIQIPINDFGTNIKVTKVAITAYTTRTTATYDISVSGSSVKNGSLTTSSDTYSSNTLNATTGNIVVTLKGSSDSRAMYLSNIAVTYETVAATSYTVTYNANGGSGTMSNSTGSSITLKECTFTAPSGKEFDEWNTAANGSGASYQAGDIVNESLNLYAIWKELPKYTVTWNVNGEVYETTQVTKGSKPTFPATPSSCDATSTTFYGWATATWDGKIDDINGKTIYTSANDMPEVNGTVTYYAVFAKKETSGSGTAGWNTVTSPADLEVGATYAISNEATNGTYLSTWDGGNNFDGSTSTICPLILGGSEGAWTFQIADGGTYNNYYLTATSQSNNRLRAVSILDEQCQFSISFDNNISNITCTTKDTHNILRYNPNGGSPIFACYSSGQSDVYLQKYSTGSTTTYSDYITSCTTEPSRCVTPKIRG